MKKGNTERLSDLPKVAKLQNTALVAFPKAT